MLWYKVLNYCNQMFELLLSLRADGSSRVGLADRKPGERHVYSPYLLCKSWLVPFIKYF